MQWRPEVESQGILWCTGKLDGENPVRSDIQGQPSTTTVIGSTIHHGRPSSHNLIYADVLVFVEFKLKTSSDDFADAVEQALLELKIQQDVQPLSTNTLLIWVVAQTPVGALYVNRGLIVRLENVDIRLRQRDFAETLLWTIAFLYHKATHNGHVQPGSILRTTTPGTEQIMQWRSEVQSHDVLCDPGCASVPFRFGGKCTYVVRGAASFSEDEAIRPAVLKWSWPRADTTKKELQTLKRLANHTWPSLTCRLPKVSMAGLSADARSPIAQALQGHEEYAAMLREPEILVVDRQTYDLWSLRQSHALTVIADHAWLLCCLWTRLRLVHGDVSTGNVASLHKAQDLQNRRQDIIVALQQRIDVISDNRQSPEKWAQCDPFPCAGVMDVENARIIDRNDDGDDVDVGRRAALSATQEYWSQADWALWVGEDEAEHRVESDFESLLYVAISILSYKQSAEPGQHWPGWQPDEWQKGLTGAKVEMKRSTSPRRHCLL